MLVELRIRDYAVVEDLTLQLGPGLNALTGETGAGKSIIVGALSLLLGERALSTAVRAGAERATVEAVFDVHDLPDVTAALEEAGFRPEDGLMILRREVAAEGRNRAWVNGSPATAGVVGKLGSALVDLHGQHEHQTLLRPKDQRAILDAYAGGTDLARQVAHQYDDVQALKSELDDREDRLREIETRADFLRFQLAEIDEADLKPGEDAALASEAARHEHAEELAQGASNLYEALYGADDSVSDQVASARRRLARLAELDASLAAQLERLDEAVHAVSDVGQTLGDYAGSIDHDPERLEAVRVRLDSMYRLMRKYGPEVADVLEAAQRVRTELGELDDSDHDLGLLRKRIATTSSELEEAAGELSRVRRVGAEALASAAQDGLPELGLPGATFEVALHEHDDVGRGGREGVEFLVSPNPGFTAQPLARIASGGELSRIMLALKSVLLEVDRVPVLVFDEIDAGIGGVVATAVAAKLAEVATRHQVFVVTHLPQVASRATGHLLVEKDISGGITATDVRSLSGAERVEEIARMLGGDPDSPTSRKHAEEMLSPRE
jgi:DNA repair protein RecN (Recombination protein N)